MEVEPMCIVENETEGSRGDRKEGGKRGRKPGRKASDKTDMKAKLERSRQSARECRARKKLRYQYLEELVADREKAVLALRRELEMILIVEYKRIKSDKSFKVVSKRIFPHVYPARSNLPQKNDLSSE
ncbi:REPTOR-binding partner isoform X2 [Bombus affinis]|uniref:REPTOR-binding partner isoform X2 n=1 Tax=Bombus affinis TaxID=309941 RepID=UPI0021B79D18|nr:REPTOR-binding partner isoform X2 [Bombus affinis]